MEESPLVNTPEPQSPVRCFAHKEKLIALLLSLPYDKEPKLNCIHIESTARDRELKIVPSHLSNLHLKQTRVSLVLGHDII